MADVEGLHLRRVAGVWQDQTNLREAEEVLGIIAGLLTTQTADGQLPSIGVVTFNRPQAELIESLIDSRAAIDAVFRPTNGLVGLRCRHGRLAGMDTLVGVFAFREFKELLMWIRRGSLLIVALLLMMVLACSTSPGSPDVTEIVVDNPELGGADVRADAGTDVGSTPLVELRVASYNASLFREQEGQLVADLSDPSHEHARGIARILQHVRPDVVLINEFDYDADHEAARLFRTNFLEVAQGADEALDYAYVYVAPSNTGVHSGFDLDNNGEAVSTPGTQAYGNDAFGYGTFEGQYAFVIYSRYPLVANGVRTFQRFLWKEMPDNMMPEGWYSPGATEVFRLSSKNHVDLAIKVDEHVLHILASHPTPPAFDGAERRNVRRNNDEIRLWNDYITPGAGEYIIDDEGQGGGLDENAFFVIVGDLNNDPFDGGGGDAIKDLLANARVTDPLPSSEGAVEKSERDGRANLQHVGDPKYDTADFSDGSVGNLRVDYALPSSNAEVLGSGVFWPRQDEPLYGLTLLSDHHLVWVDLRLAR